MGVSGSHLVVRDIERELCCNQLYHDGLLQTGGDSFQRDPVLGTQVRKVLPINLNGGVAVELLFFSGRRFLYCIET